MKIQASSIFQAVWFSSAIVIGAQLALTIAPFYVETEVGDSKRYHESAHVVALPKWYAFIGASPDSNLSPSESDISFSINGEALAPHTPHSELFLGKAGFSHWGDSIIFSLGEQFPRDNFIGTIKFKVTLTSFLLTGALVVFIFCSLFYFRNNKLIAQLIRFFLCYMNSARMNWLNLLKNVLFSIVVAILFILAAEMTAQFYFSINKAKTGPAMDTALFHYHPRVVHTHPRNLTIQVGVEQYESNSAESLFARFFDLSDDSQCAKNGIVFKSNSLGFRTLEFSELEEKTKDTVRIIILGGSASISWNIGEACTLDRKLQKHLSRSLPKHDVQIINLGNGAWKSFQELAALQQYGLELEPDIVIAFNGFNDMSHSTSMAPTRAYASGHNEAAFRTYYRSVHEPTRHFVNALSLPRLIKLLTASKTSPVLTEDSEKIKKSEYRRSDITAPLTSSNPVRGQLSTRVIQYPLDREKIKARTDFLPYATEVITNYTRNIELMAKSIESFEG